MTTDEMIVNPPMLVGEKLLLCPELKETPGEDVAKEDVTQELVDENQTYWAGPYTVI